MKRRTSLALMLALNVLLSTAGSPLTAQGQQRVRLLADTGVVTLGPNQALRVTVAAGDVNGDDAVSVLFRRMSYTQGACNGGVCKYALTSQTTSGPVTLMPGEAASAELVATTYGRGVVLGNGRDVRVTAQIIDTTTGDVISIWVPQGSPAVGRE